MDVHMHKVFPMEALEGKDVFSIMNKTIPILEGMGINYWASAGTVLGLVREEKGYIDWDTDIDFETYATTIELNNLKALMVANGFELIRHMEEDGLYYQIAFIDKATNIIVDFYCYYKVSDTMLECKTDVGTLQLPIHFINDKKLVKGYKCPSPVEDYLVYRYGSTWKTPIKKTTGWQDTAGEALRR